MEEKQEEGIQEIQKIKSKVRDNAMSLRIARVPIETKRQFVDLANEDFAGDYGMTLKWLMEDRWNKLLALEIKVAELESKITGKSVKLISTIGGREISVKRHE